MAHQHSVLQAAPWAAWPRRVSSGPLSKRFGAAPWAGGQAATCLRTRTMSSIGTWSRCCASQAPFQLTLV